MQGQQTAQVTLTVDIVLPRLTETSLDVLLIKRRKPPYQDMWALPGGKLNEDDSSLMHAILRETQEETGIDLGDLFLLHTLQQVQTFGKTGRDPRGRYVSVLYMLTKPLPENIQVQAGDNACEARWFPMLVNHPPLAFDHKKLLDHAWRSFLDWCKVDMPGVQSLRTPMQCMWGCESARRCPLPASWFINGWATCEECVRTLANMNSDHEELLRPALLTLAKNAGQTRRGETSR